jgi:D-alanyl-D-alanine carboxypeptidase
MPADVLVAAAHEMPRVSLDAIPANARVVHVRTGHAVDPARSVGTSETVQPAPSAASAAPTAVLSTVAPASDRTPASPHGAPSPATPSPAAPSSAASSPAMPHAARPAVGAKAVAAAKAAAAAKPFGVRPQVVRLRPSGRHGRNAARFGVVGALAAVTVAVPLSHGSFGGADVLSGLPSDRSSLPSTVSALTAQPSVGSPPASLAASGEVVIDERALGNVSRAANRQTLPGCDPSARAAGLNGQLATDDLCTLWDGHTQLRADAASALAGLNAVYAARFGADMCISSGYRTLAVQYQLKRDKGGLAATPGKSNHGWGLAVDLCSDLTTGDRWEWLNENAGIYGFENPAWAQAGGSGPYERWHWEYLKGVMADGEYYGNG